jgi:hypothetical protein
VFTGPLPRNASDNRSAAFGYSFLWAKWLNEKDIHNEMFSVYGGKCLSRKAVHGWADKFSQGRSQVTDDAQPGAEVTEKTVKKLLRCGFRPAGKAMGQVYQCWWRIYREIKVFSRLKYHMFYVLYPFVPYLLTIPRILYFHSCL